MSSSLGEELKCLFMLKNIGGKALGLAVCLLTAFPSP